MRTGRLLKRLIHLQLRDTKNGEDWIAPTHPRVRVLP